MASIQARKDGNGKTRWRVQIRIKGHPTVSKTFDRKTDAKEWAKQTETDIKRGQYFQSLESTKHTFGEMIDRYLKDVMPRKSKDGQRHQTHQLKRWKNELGSYTLSEVTPPKIVEARDKLTREKVRGGGVRSPASVNRHLAALSHVYTVAVREWGWLEDSPMRRVSRLQEPRGRVRFLNDDERAALLEACKKSEEALLYPVVLVALSTGARQGEILNLRWGAIDLDRKVIRLENTKNNERRALPLAGPALGEMKRLSKIRRIDTDLVFPHSNGERPFNLRGAWEKTVKEAKLEDFRFHDLRHTAASYLAMNGATLAEIAGILGHKTLQMVHRYSHLTEQHTSSVVERMNKKMFGE